MILLHLIIAYLFLLTAAALCAWIWQAIELNRIRRSVELLLADRKPPKWMKQ